MSNKKIQIPEKLFFELIKYHLGEVPADEKYIKTELEKKLNSLAARERYSQQLKRRSNK